MAGRGEREERRSARSRPEGPAPIIRTYMDQSMWVRESRWLTESKPGGGLVDGIAVAVGCG